MTTAAALLAAARFAVGFTFLASGLAKLPDVGGFVRGVRAYRLVPARLAGPVGLAVVAAELAVALALLGGVLLRPASAAAVALCVVFGVAVGVNLRRRRQLACHCFGNRGEQISWRSLVRIGLLLAPAAGLAAASPGSASAGDRPASLLRPEGLLEASLGLAAVMAARWLLAGLELRASRAGHSPAPHAAGMTDATIGASGGEPRP
jgi:hypothetical protein